MPQAQPLPKFETPCVWWEVERKLPVSMAGYSGPTPNNGIRGWLGSTRHLENRCKGFAPGRMASQALSQKLLDDGEVLPFYHTILAIPNLHHVYQKMGHEPVTDATVLFVFVGSTTMRTKQFAVSSLAATRSSAFTQRGSTCRVSTKVERAPDRVRSFKFTYHADITVRILPQEVRSMDSASPRRWLFQQIRDLEVEDAGAISNR